MQRSILHRSLYNMLQLDNSTCGGLSMGCAKSRDWLPTQVTTFVHEVAADTVITLVMSLPSEAHIIYGAPKMAYVTLTFPEASATIVADVRWIGKTATRLPEATLLMLPLSTCPKMNTGRRHRLPPTYGCGWG
jgi:hypothetical protein